MGADVLRDRSLAGGAPAAHRAVVHTVRGQSGISLVEVLVAALVVGITITGVSLMYGRGTSWMAAIGDDRVALNLAQERIESVRAEGWGSVAALPGVVVEEEVRPARIGPTRTDRADARAFRRVTCVQHVDPASPGGLSAPPYDAACADGAPSNTRRITVVVIPVAGDGSAGSPASPASSAVTLQGWITSTGL